ncbi:MAG: alpha/beta hydrolase [Myxococcales bacterium]|nr:alpha/beta hydrolase [Myxococcales bacterium]
MTNLGCRTLELPFAVRVLYPTEAPARAERFGAYELELAHDAPVAAHRMLLVAFSHGTGGTPFAYRGLAKALVAANHAVALITHPGNNRDDDSLANTVQNLEDRPRHVTQALDAAFADPHLAPHLVPERAAVFGHSMGGYTALAVSGARPMALPQQTADGKAAPVAVTPDRRVVGAILFAPALPWLMAPGALDDVHARVMVRACEKDEAAPPFFIERIVRGLPPRAELDYAVVPGAGHFACFWPLHPLLATLPPGQDPPGFDRAAYQPALHADVLGFLSRVTAPLPPDA